MHSYRKKHVRHKLHKIKPKKPLVKSKLFWFLILTTLLFLIITYFLFFFAGLQVSSATVSGNKKIESDKLEDFVLSASNTKLVDFGFLKLNTKNILLENTSRISNEIITQFPRIETATVRKVFPKALAVDIVEREPIGTYCQNDVSECFLLDQNGVVFEPISNYAEISTSIKQVSNNNHIYLGQQVMERNIAMTIYKVQKNLQDNFQINLKEAFITSPLRMDVITSENWEIYFNMDSEYSIDSQLLKLDLLLKGEITEDIRPTLQYIDLRFKDRAFYK
jgi:cell division septal protein FtsQ